MSVMVLALLAHLVGDYLIQSHWMASEKTKRWWPAIAHAVTYGVPFMFIVPSIWSWLVIVTTHAVIDHYRLARHVVWLKNLLAPSEFRASWADCKATGYPSDSPVWLSVWLMIIADNTLHLVINALAIGFIR